jgi:hypothetical protein
VCVCVYIYVYIITDNKRVWKQWMRVFESMEEKVKVHLNKQLFTAVLSSNAG